MVPSTSKITRNWKKMTWPGDCRKAFHTSVVSTLSPLNAPVMPSWKYFSVQPDTTA